jgi:hypothetical protein
MIKKKDGEADRRTPLVWLGIDSLMSRLKCDLCVSFQVERAVRVARCLVIVRKGGSLKA